MLCFLRNVWLGGFNMLRFPCESMAGRVEYVTLYIRTEAGTSHPHTRHPAVLSAMCTGVNLCTPRFIDP
jgi:hypothetical protein